MTLQEVFTKFATFGKSHEASTGPAVTMDGKAFSKLCKDCKLIDSKLTATDVDLIFANNKVKNKAERKITFQQFTVALELVAEKKGAPVSDIQQKIVEMGGPASNNVQKADTSGVYDKLTDASRYTGAHKSRFDEGGKGKGLVGSGSSKDSHPKVTGSTPSSSSSSSSTTRTSPPKKATPTTTPSTGSTATKTAAKKPVAATNTTKTETNSGIFSKLTDTSQYTGAHKHRFDEHGKGRGAEGRDVGGNGSGTHGGKAGDLSSMTRTNLNKAK